MRTIVGKLCTRCKEWKGIKSFSTQSNGYLKRKAECKACMVLRFNERRDKYPELIKLSQHKSYHKHHAKRLADRKYYYWKNRVSQREKYKIYYHANKEAIKQSHKTPHWRRLYRARYLKLHYNLSLEQYAALMAKYSGKCVICLDTPKTRGLRIDHSHKTGLVRGMLCDHCNRGLGYFKEDIMAMKRAISYLEKDGDI